MWYIPDDIDFHMLVSWVICCSYEIELFYIYQFIKICPSIWEIYQGHWKVPDQSIVKNAFGRKLISTLRLWWRSQFQARLGDYGFLGKHDLVHIFKTMPVIETGHRFCIDKKLIPLQTLKMNAPSMTIVNSKQFKGNDKLDFELDKYD